MDGNRGAEERRVHRRVELRTTAVLVKDGVTVGRFTVQNLSAGGVLLTGGQAVPAGDKVHILLELSRGEPVRVRAEVVRCVEAFEEVQVLALDFCHPSDDTQDALQEAVVNELMRRERPSVLLFEDDAALAERVAGELHILGRRVIRVSTPLDAVRALEDPNEWIDTVLIDPAVDQVDGPDLLSFVAKEYPGKRRVLLQREDYGLKPPLARTQTERAHAILPELWEASELTKILLSAP